MKGEVLEELITVPSGQKVTFLDVIMNVPGPEGLAARLVSGTKLANPTLRKALWDGGMEAIKASDDPMIQYALRTDAVARTARGIFPRCGTAGRGWRPWWPRT